MIKVNYDPEYNTIIIEFEGKIDAAQGEQYLPDIQKVLSKVKKGFNLLVDLSSVQTVDPKIQGVIKKVMDLLNAQGVTKILRVIPDPAHDIGLNIMSLFHYSEEVKVLTLRSREEAQERLGEKN